MAVGKEKSFACCYDLYPVGGLAVVWGIWDDPDMIVDGFFLCVSLPAIGRTLIPRYFSTVFEGGVTDLYYVLKHSKESYHNSSITVDCDQCVMVTQHGKPMFTKVRAGLGDKACSSLGVLEDTD